MKKAILILVINFLSLQGFAQLNQISINFNLSKSNSIVSVGGDLVIIDNNICPIKNNNNQTLFESQSSNTIFIDVNNQNSGNSCVTLIIETINGTLKKEIPEDTQTGVLKFFKVKKAYLSIQKRLLDRTIETANSNGIATVWF